ncbi:MAG TPA: hypothetical protein DCG33_03930 [Prevotellaceae bacterium]|nr:hypothetical protein [Prevotellaceae bacterium]
MNEMIKVRTPAGYIRINPNEFFPAKSSDVRKLCRALKEGGCAAPPDAGYATLNILIELIERCREKLVKVEQCRKEYKQLYEASINFKSNSIYDDVYYSKRALIVSYVLQRIDRDAKKLESNLDILEGEYNGTD